MTKTELIQKWENRVKDMDRCIADMEKTLDCLSDMEEQKKFNSAIKAARDRNQLFKEVVKDLKQLGTVGEFDLDDPLGEKEMSDRIEFIKKGVVSQLTELVKSDTDTGQQYMWGLASVGIGAEGSENPTNVPRIRMSLQDAIKLIVELSNKFNLSEENHWK